MLNQLNKSVATYLLESLSDVPNYFYAQSNLTWAFIWVHETKSHRIRLSPQVRFKLKIRENSLRKFFLDLNCGAKQARNTRGVTTNPP